MPAGFSRFFSPTLWGAAFALAMRVALVAAEPGPTWFARVWQSEDGLPDNSLTGVVQTQEGYLWVATQHALARFDGVRFRRIPLPAVPGVPQPSIRALLRGGNGELWLAIENGLAICLSSRGTNLFTAASGLPVFRPTSLTQDGTGAVWIGYVDGSACRIQDNRVDRFRSRDGLVGDGQCWLRSDARGQIWYAKAGRVGVFQNGQFTELASFPDRNIRLCAARDGGVWICAGTELWRFAENGQPTKLAELTPTRTGVSPRMLHEDRASAVWVGTSGGLFRYDGKEVSAIETSHREITDLAEDREGNIWAGTGGGGLNRLRTRVVTFESAASGLPLETVRSLCEDAGGRVWAVSQDGLVMRQTSGRWEVVPGNGAWPEGQATCLAADREVGVWIGTYRGGLHRWHEGKVHSLRRSDGLVSDAVRSMLVATNGDLWIGLESSNCVQRLRQGELAFVQLPAGSRPVRTMAEDRNGHVWMGTAGGQLFHVSPDGLADVTSDTPNPPQPIRCLHATPDGSVWIGYAGGGVGRLQNGRFSQVGTDRGLHDDFISFIASDENGSLWFGADRGVFEVRQRELEEVMEGRADRIRSLVYGRDEALPSLQANYGYSPVTLRSRDGRLWFPMRTGLALIRPDPVRASHIPPPIILERLLLDGRTVHFRENEAILHEADQSEPTGTANPALELPPGHRRLDLEFTALSFIAPENVHFRYRLEGLDSDWSEPSTLRSVSYPRLPAGDYRFVVTACNNAGVWNPNGAALRFTVRPFFWQTWWFRLAAVGGFTAGLIALVRYLSFRSLQRKLERLERETALQKERARIAKDIHDDLGASLTQITLLGELAQHDLTAPEKLGEHITKIAGTARRGVKSLEEIVWAVNPRNDTLAHLLDYVGQFAVDFLRAGDIRCRIDFPEQPPARNLPAEVRHNVFLAVKEALNNIVKHSRASEVWLRVIVTDAALRLSVEDNGRGFACAPNDAWADGLRNMRQRMAEIGGACEIESQPGAGARITLTTPWHPTSPA